MPHATLDQHWTPSDVSVKFIPTRLPAIPDPVKSPKFAFKDSLRMDRKSRSAIIGLEVEEDDGAVEAGSKSSLNIK